VAGFAEIGGHDTAHLAARARVLSDDLQAIFPGACDVEDLQPWAGLRPATPTGVPVISRTRIDNLVLNLGHGALGFTLSAGSAALLGDLVAGRQSSLPAVDYAA
jgi:D-amino-acid dehydrogenase